MGGGVDPNEKISNSKATMVLLKCFIGSGVLSLPFALAHAGFVMGVSGLFLFALLSIQGILMMVACAQTLQSSLGKRCQTYPALATAVAGPKLGSVVSVMCCLTQLGVCCVMLNFVATSLLAVAPCEAKSHVLVTDEHAGSLGIVYESNCFGLRLLPAKRVFIALVLPVFIALSWLPSINALAPLAKIANFFMLIVILLTLFFAVQSYYAEGQVSSCEAWPPSSQSYLLFVGNCFYAFEGAATVIPVVHAMKDDGVGGPEGVKGVVRNALYFVLFVQVVVAVTCYVGFQDIDNGSITAVLATNPNIPGVSKTAVMFMNLLVMLAVLFSFPLQLFPAIQLLESACGVGAGNEMKARGKIGTHSAPAEERQQKHHLVPTKEEEEGEGGDNGRGVKDNGEEGNGGGKVGDDDDDDDRNDGGDDDDQATFDYRMVDAYDQGDGEGGVPLPEEPHHRGSLHPSSLPPHQLLFRTCVVLGVFVVTEAVPDLGLIIDILGAIFGSFLVIILPNYLSILSTKFLTPEQQERQPWPWFKVLTIVFTAISAIGAGGAAITEIFAGPTAH